MRMVAASPIRRVRITLMMKMGIKFRNANAAVLPQTVVAIIPPAGIPGTMKMETKLQIVIAVGLVRTAIARVIVEVWNIPMTQTETKPLIVGAARIAMMVSALPILREQSGPMMTKETKFRKAIAAVTAVMANVRRILPSDLMMKKEMKPLSGFAKLLAVMEAVQNIVVAMIIYTMKMATEYLLKVVTVGMA